MGAIKFRKLDLVLRISDPNFEFGAIVVWVKDPKALCSGDTSLDGDWETLFIDMHIDGHEGGLIDEAASIGHSFVGGGFPAPVFITICK